MGIKERKMGIVGMTICHTVFIYNLGGESMTDFKTSETAKNLMRAFAGESQARNRYTFAAGLAKEQKMPMVEAVFSYTADQEKEHAEIFYDYLKPLDKETIFIDGGYPVDLEKNTLAQLNAAAHNEYEEHDVVYKSFGDIAQKEGFSQICWEPGTCMSASRRRPGSAPTADIYMKEKNPLSTVRSAATTRAILPAGSWRHGI